MTPLTFEYEFPSDRTYYPSVGEGYRTGLPGRILGHGLGSIQRLAERDCPPVARLAIPGHEVTLDLRLAGDVLMRTVCAPGTKLPCGVDEFLSAAGRMTGWRDSPFDDKPDYGDSAELREAYPPERFDARRWGASNQTERRTAIEAALCGYAAIGETVYVACDEPVLCRFDVKVQKGKVGSQSRRAVGWHFKDFDMYSDPVKGRQGPRNIPWDDRLPCRAPMEDSMDLFRIDREDDANAFLEVAAESWHPLYVARERCVPFVEPGLLGSKDDVVHILRAARLQTIGKKRDWGGLADMSDDSIREFLEARRILAKPDHAIYPADLRAAVEHLRAASDPERIESRLKLLLKRWDAVESRRDLSRTLAAADTATCDADEAAFLAMSP